MGVYQSRYIEDAYYYVKFVCGTSIINTRSSRRKKHFEIRIYRYLRIFLNVIICDMSRSNEWLEILAIGQICTFCEASCVL